MLPKSEVHLLMSVRGQTIHQHFRDERAFQVDAHPRIKKVIELLLDPHCKLFQLLVIDYDLIEVNVDISWSIK